MIFKLDNLKLHTATVIRKATGELLFDRVTIEEAQQLGSMFLYKQIRFEEGRFVINHTSYAIVSKKELFVVGHIAWIEGGAGPFFSIRELTEAKEFKVVEQQQLGIYELQFEKNGVSVIKRTDCKESQHLEDYIHVAEFGRPDPDNILSIPEELEVEEDEQLKASIKLDWLPRPEEMKRPAWLGEDGTYHANIHQAECEELSRMYPSQVKPMTISVAGQEKLASTIRMVDRSTVHPASMTPDAPLSIVQQTRLLVQQDRVAGSRS
jgi:hypothetical protein